MSKPKHPTGLRATGDELAPAVIAAGPFGPQFFVGQLRAFARDRCPDPAEALPVVELRLVSGEVLDVCHIIGLAPSWVALAVRDGERASGAVAMRTELVPYEIIMRVTIRATRERSPHIGFDDAQVPRLIEEPTSSMNHVAEEALRAAASPPAPAKRGELQ